MLAPCQLKKLATYFGHPNIMGGTMTNCKLYSFLKDFLRDIYKGQHMPKPLINAMAMIATIVPVTRFSMLRSLM